MGPRLSLLTTDMCCFQLSILIILLRACLPKGGGPLVGEVSCLSGVANPKTCRPGSTNFWLVHSTACNKLWVVGAS